MRLTRLFLAFCLLASLACDIWDGDLDLDLDLNEQLTVTVMTVGENLDPDGYTLAVTGVANEAVGLNESVVFDVLRIDITVELLGVAANCVVDTNPQTVHVSGPTTVVFVVECS